MLNRQFKVSFIVPIYNAENYIESAIQSVLCLEKDWIELVLVNDGSSDKSHEICKKYVSERVRYIRTENMGAGHARNVGIRNAKGEWIGFLDSDDLILKNFFDDKMYYKLGKLYDEKVDIIYTPKMECDYGLENKPIITYPEDIGEINHYMPSLEFWTCLYRKEFLEQNRIFFFEYRVQDVESAFRFRCFSKAENVYIYKKRFFILHRNNPTSNVNTWNYDKVLWIRSLVYCQLAIEFEKSEFEVKQWLFSQSVFNLKELIKRNLHLGLLIDKSDQGNKEIKKLLKDFKLNSNYLKRKYKVFLNILKIVYSNKFVWKIRLFYQKMILHML